MAVTQYSMRLVKTFPFRDNPVKEFSNRYYFDGGAPTDTDQWHDLFDAVVAAEKLIHRPQVTLVQAFGYGPASDVAVARKTYTQAGTLAVGTGTAVPGDCAAVLRMATTKLSSRLHTVYVFSYFHGLLSNWLTTTNDDLFTSQKAAMETYGAAWLAGISAGGRVFKRTTPDGHLTTGHQVDRYIGHRDFPR